MNMSNLPEAGSPLILANGKKIDPRTKKLIRENQIEIPSHSEAQQLVVGTRRKLADLPLAPKAMNAVALVAMYTVLGLEDDEIGVAINLSADRVRAIKETPAYRETQENAKTSLVEANKTKVRGIIEEAAEKAARRMIEISEDGEDQIAVVASKDILDRAGHRPADVLEVRKSVLTGLRIEVIDNREATRASEKLEAIDVDFSEEEGEGNGDSS